MIDKSTHFKQVCHLLLSLIEAGTDQIWKMRLQPLFQAAAWQPSSFSRGEFKKMAEEFTATQNDIVLTIDYQEAFLLFNSTLGENL